MESSRSKKTRSAGPESKILPRLPVEERPGLGDRAHTSPSVERRRQSHSKYRESTKVSAVHDRDSKASIRDDPFFRPYQTPQSVRLAEKSGRIHRPPNADELAKHGDMSQINLVVLGALGVGKSTFVQKALDLRHHPVSHYSSKKMSLDGIIYLVRLLEISMEEIIIDDDRKVRWPRIVSDRNMPSVDGVLVLYDVTNPESIQGVPEILEYSRQRSTASSKSRPATSNKVDLGKSPTFPKIAHDQKTSSESASTPSGVPFSPQPKSPSKPIPEKGPRPLTVDGEEQEPRTLTPSQQLPKDTLDRQNGQVALNKFHTTRPENSSSPDDILAEGGQPPSSHQDLEVSHCEPLLNTTSNDATGISHSQAYNSFLNMDDDFDDSSARDNKMDHLIEIAKLKVSPQPVASITGDSMEELVDRLLAVPMSKQESKFIPIFLCLYRKFATPAQLLSLIIKKFDDVERGSDAQLIRIGEQLRYLQILSQWAGDYPNDFVHASVRNQILAFVARLDKNRIFSYSAKEVRCHLEKSIDNGDDEGWTPFENGDLLMSEDPISRIHIPATDAPTTSSSTLADSKEDLSSKKSWTSSQEDVQSARHSLNLSQASSGVGQLQPGTNSNQSLPIAEPSQEEAGREASKLVPIPRRPLSKLIWRRFMEISDEDFGRELTRIDWVMYSSIRPRDLIRHVGLASIRQASKENKSSRTSRSLRNVDRMIDHFNHLTLFVAAMILFRDKPKHRAQALEKFMSISWKLRQMNNYNSLGALLAGINNSTISRLAETWALIPPSTSKQFMRLNILMGSAKSHFAYRLAWENSFAERIPFIPLHRRDLVAAEDGNRTLVGPGGDRINWKKFEVMGEVVVGIQKSQDRPYSFGHRNLEVAWMVLETKILEGDEDSVDPYQELHERSVAVEPGRGNVDSGRKNWFKR